MKLRMLKGNKKDGFVNSEIEEQCLKNSSRRSRQAGLDSEFESMLNMPAQTPDQIAFRESLQKAIEQMQEEALLDLR